MLRQEWLFSLTYAWFGFIQMWVWFENYRLTCIYRKKLFALFQFIWETNVIVQAKAHWNTQHRLNIVAVLSHFSRVRLFATLLTIAHKAPWSMGSSRQEYWSGLPCPLPGESSWPRDWTQVTCTAGRFFTTEPARKPRNWFSRRQFFHRWGWGEMVWGRFKHSLVHAPMRI